jgi:tRNA threonylcarbamoyladenosine biosynthesis protein TsaB
VHYYHSFMLVLALDTTTRGGSCALAREGRVLIERTTESAEYAARLPGDLMALLDHAGVTLAGIDVFAVATGPGSFTGLRIGIATMQGLAFASSRPLIGVSTFDALAHRANAPRTATWIDAWRGEVYAAVYRAGEPVGEPSVTRPEHAIAAVRGASTCFIGDGVATYRELIERELGAAATIADPVAPPLAGIIAQLASSAARRGESPPPHAIRPIYVRRSDAELVRDARASR